MELGLNLHVVDKVAGFSRAQTITCGGIPANFCARLPFSPTLARVRCGLLFPPICEIIILCVSDFFRGPNFFFFIYFWSQKLAITAFCLKFFISISKVLAENRACWNCEYINLKYSIIFYFSKFVIY